jgi:hypothetical protein
MTAGQQQQGLWFKSSRSGSGENNCVETRFDGPTVRIRDSKYQGDPAAQPVITVTTRQWAQFLAVLAGNSSHSALSIATDGHGFVTLASGGMSLIFTPAEWDAFTAGVTLGEFAAA